jgi:hypothetical protein
VNKPPRDGNDAIIDSTTVGGSLIADNPEHAQVMSSTPVGPEQIQAMYDRLEQEKVMRAEAAKVMQ